MEGIITIVIIAAAIIFKVVSKKLNSAADKEVFPPIPVEPDMVVDSLPEVDEAPRAVKDVPAPSVQKEMQVEKKEKIDPKKLVVYSEIMKPKYLD